MISEAIAMVSLIRSIYRERKEQKYVGALFNWRGERISGEPEINLDVFLGDSDDRIWWFQPREFEDYQYIRMPVNAGAVYEVLRRTRDELNPRVDVFRYIPSVPPGVFHSNAYEVPNANANFMVFAYRPEDLLRTFSD